MRLRRRRVFVSYSREEAPERDDLVKWLDDHRVEPVYDDATEEPEETVLTESIAKKLRTSDCVIAIGTRKSLGSRWVRDEVAYAATLRRPPSYLPVLVEPIPHDELPDWFLRKKPLVGGVKYLKCFDEKRTRKEIYDDVLSRPIEEVRRGSPITLGAAVVLALMLFLGAPLLLWWIFRPIVDSADRDIRDAQVWVEELNARIERAADGSDRSVVPMITSDQGQRTEVAYRERATGRLLVRDAFDGRNLVRRHFFREERVVAFDAIVTLDAENGAISQVKLRRIFPRGPGGPVIEDTFDSDGKLISKRMRMSPTRPWRYFAERGRTLYAVYPFVLAYR